MKSLESLKKKIYPITGITTIIGFIIVIFLLINFFYKIKKESSKLNENLIQTKITRFNLLDFEKIKNRF